MHQRLNSHDNLTPRVPRQYGARSGPQVDGASGRAAAAATVGRVHPAQARRRRLHGRGGTIGWLITPEAVVLVDSQFPDTATLCLEGVKSRSKRRIDLLINTHHHGDHTSGNIVFKPETPHILAHENVPALQKKSAEERGNVNQQAYADQTFGKTWDQDIGHERLEMRHYGPGHTGGDAVVTFAKANVVHMGDLVFRARHPFVDRPGGASVRNWLDDARAGGEGAREGHDLHLRPRA